MKLLGDDCWWAPEWMKRIQQKVGLGEPVLLDTHPRNGGDRHDHEPPAPSRSSPLRRSIDESCWHPTQCRTPCRAPASTGNRSAQLGHHVVGEHLTESIPLSIIGQMPP